MTNHAVMMVMMMGGSGGMGGGMMGSDMMMKMNGTASMQSQTGSSVIDAGWHSTTVKVKVDGVGISAYNASDLNICVFPHIA